MKRILAGPRAVEEALRVDPKRIAIVYVQRDGAARKLDFWAEAQRAGVRCETRDAAELDAIANGLRHQGVVGIGGDYPYADLDVILARAKPAPLLLALDQLSDPHNFGAIIRSAIAFGADGVITLKDRAAPVTGVVVRAAAGATERAKIARVTNLARTLQQLRDTGLSVIGLDAGASQTLETVPFDARGRVLVIGSEGDGLRRLTRDACDALVRIHMPGGFESLNASVAAAIALYESSRMRAALDR